MTETQLLQGADILDALEEGFAAFRGDRLVAWNGVFIELLGIPARLAVAGTPAQALEELGAGRIDAPLIDLREQAAKARLTGDTIRLERRSGDGACLALRYCPRGDAVLLTLRDISDELRSRDKLQHAQKLSAVGQMIGGIAHDFNNILAVLLMNLETLQEIQLPPDVQALRLAMMSNAVHNGTRLVRHLLAFSRRLPLEPEILCLSDLMPRVVDLLQRALGDDLRVDYAAPERLWTTLLDAAQFEAVFLHLALAARETAPHGGVLLVALANATQAADAAVTGGGPFVLLTLSCQGAAGERENRLLQPRIEERGPGWEMAADFLRASGGHMLTDAARPGEWAVRLYFPRSVAQTAPATRGPASSAPAAGETILVVEDDNELRSTVAALLQDLGYTVLEAGSGQAALLMIENGQRADLIFTDVILAGPVSARVLTRRAREILPEIRILFTSGYTEGRLVDHGALDRDTEFLHKPFRKKALAEGVSRILRAPPDRRGA